MSLTRLAILLFVAASALGPLYTVAGYSPVAHVISQLAAQNTPNNFVMASAFVLLGGAVALEGWRSPQRAMLPFVAFGLAFAAAGFFGHRPIDPAIPYTPWVDTAHSVLASVSGVSLTLGFAWQARRAGSLGSRAVCGLLALACVGLPLLMLAAPGVQGLTQRGMYLLVFAWLFLHDPRHAAP